MIKTYLVYNLRISDTTAVYKTENLEEAIEYAERFAKDALVKEFITNKIYYYKGKMNHD